MKDSLGDRMKAYENAYRLKFPKRSHVVIRVDGKAFHTYTKGCIRPFDLALIECMDETAKYLAKNVMGVKLAYVQSDEISLVLTDFEKIETQPWFDNNLQKMVSVSASMATRSFNEYRLGQVGFHIQEMKWAEFDSRAFLIPQLDEVINYLVWRQQDATRNSISSVAQSLYSPSELHGKDGNAQQEMIFQKGINWNDYDGKLKRGRVIIKEPYKREGSESISHRWVSIAPPIFTQDREFLSRLIQPNE